MGEYGREHPFVLVLVIPKAIGGSVTARDDPLDSDVGRFEKRLDEFVGEVDGNVGEQIGEWGHGF